MIRLVVLALWIGLGNQGCRDNADAGLADASSFDAVPQPDARPPKPHEPPTAAAIEYFSDISDGLSGQALVLALHDKLEADHESLSFAALYNAYEIVDGDRDGCAGIFDFYSTKCWQPGEACGNYTKEGDCFNREHSWPKSWWGGATGPDQHDDLITVIPADGYVNNSRGQLPLGIVPVATYTSSNGSKRGTCSTNGIGFGERCFEPSHDLKGDFARMFFYMAVRYEGDIACCDEIAVSQADIKPWQETLLREWHVQDPVDIWERERNERVFGIQKNRNPFVDYPAFVEKISDF